MTKHDNYANHCAGVKGNDPESIDELLKSARINVPSTFSPFTPPTTLSIAERMLMKTGIIQPTTSTRSDLISKPNVWSPIELPSMQINYAREITSAAHIKSMDWNHRSPIDPLIQTHGHSTREIQSSEISNQYISEGSLPDISSSVEISSKELNTFQDKIDEKVRLLDEILFESHADVHMRSNTPALQTPSSNEPTTASEDFLDGIFIVLPYDDHNYAASAKTQLPSQQQSIAAASPITQKFPPQQQSTVTLPFNQFDVIEATPNTVKSPESNVDSTFKIQPRTHQLSNKIVIHSCESIKSPHESSTNLKPTNRNVLMKSHKTALILPQMNTTKNATQVPKTLETTSKPTVKKTVKSKLTIPMKTTAQSTYIPVAPFDMDQPATQSMKHPINGNGPKSTNIPVARVPNASKPNATHPIKTAAKSSTYIPSASVHAADAVKWNCVGTAPTEIVQRKNATRSVPIQNGSKRNSTPIPIVTTPLKRKSNENIGPIVPNKMQKVERSVRVEMTEIATSATLFNLTDVSVKVIDTVTGAEKNVSGLNLTVTSPKKPESCSISDCFKKLERNGISIFKVPDNRLSKNLQKFMNIFTKNNVSVKRLNK